MIIVFKCRFSFLYKGITLANFHCEGYFPNTNDRFISLEKDGHKPSAHSIVILFPKPSHLLALVTSTFYINLKVSSFSTYMYEWWQRCPPDGADPAVQNSH
jgi:hypothetical protein